MIHLLFVFSIILALYQILKEKFEPKPPKNALSNWELYQNDILSGVSHDERMKNMYAGKYVLEEIHTEPHRDKDGRIIIENDELFYRDCDEYGAEQAYKWVNQGKYNLTTQELLDKRKRQLEKYDKLHKLIKKV